LKFFTKIVTMLDTLRGEHLAKKEYYIQTCIYSWFLQSLDDLIKKWEIRRKLFEDAEFVNRFDCSNNRNCKINFKGDHWYVISDINEKAKYSIWYFDCLGLVVVWEHKDTWKNISFITHHDPKFLVFPKFAKQFEVDLKLYYIKNFCKSGSVDVVLIGWLIAGEFEEFVEKKYEKYRYSIDLTSNVVKDVFWFFPVIVGWPSIGDNWNLNRIIHSKSIFFDTQNRRLYLLKWYNDFHFHFIWEWIEEYKEQIKQILLRGR